MCLIIAPAWSVGASNVCLHQYLLCRHFKWPQQPVKHYYFSHSLVGRAVAPSNFASLSGADLAPAADVATAFCPYMQDRRIQLYTVTRSPEVRLSGHPAIQQCCDHLHCGEDGISLKTLRYRQSLPPAAGLLSGLLVATQASTQTSEARA